MLACATAALGGAHFFVINGPEVVSEYYGESEAGLRGIFAAASVLAPSVCHCRDDIRAILSNFPAKRMPVSNLVGI